MGTMTRNSFCGLLMLAILGSVAFSADSPGPEVVLTHSEKSEKPSTQKPATTAAQPTTTEPIRTTSTTTTTTEPTTTTTTMAPPSPTIVDLKAFFDIRIGGEYIGRIVFGLFNATCPKTVANFAALCDGTYGYGYQGSPFHRTIRNFMIQGGDIVSGDGYGFKSIYGEGEFPDENFIVKNFAGGLGMANRGPNSNGCQIYINTVTTSWLDNVHNVFGKVLSGYDVVKAIEYNPTDSHDRPIKPVIISYSGTIPVSKPFYVDIQEYPRY